MILRLCFVLFIINIELLTKNSAEYVQTHQTSTSFDEALPECQTSRTNWRMSSTTYRDDWPFDPVHLPFVFPWFGDPIELVYLSPNLGIHISGQGPCCNGKHFCSFSVYGGRCDFNNSYYDVIAPSMADFNPGGDYPRGFHHRSLDRNASPHSKVNDDFAITPISAIEYWATSSCLCIWFKEIPLFFEPRFKGVERHLQTLRHSVAVGIFPSGRITFYYQQVSDPLYVPGSGSSHQLRSWMVGLRSKSGSDFSTSNKMEYFVTPNGTYPPKELVQSHNAINFWPLGSRTCAFSNPSTVLPRELFSFNLDHFVTHQSSYFILGINGAHRYLVSLDNLPSSLETISNSTISLDMILDAYIKNSFVDLHGRSGFDLPLGCSVIWYSSSSMSELLWEEKVVGTYLKDGNILSCPVSLPTKRYINDILKEKGSNPGDIVVGKVLLFSSTQRQKQLFPDLFNTNQQQQQHYLNSIWDQVFVELSTDQIDLVLTNDPNSTLISTPRTYFSPSTSQVSPLFVLEEMYPDCPFACLTCGVLDRIKCNSLYTLGMCPFVPARYVGSQSTGGDNNADHPDIDSRLRQFINTLWLLTGIILMLLLLFRSLPWVAERVTHLIQFRRDLLYIRQANNNNNNLDSDDDIELSGLDGDEYYFEESGEEEQWWDSDSNLDDYQVHEPMLAPDIKEQQQQQEQQQTLSGHSRQEHSSDRLPLAPLRHHLDDRKEQLENDPDDIHHDDQEQQRWSCHRCTFLNPDIYSWCRMCETQRQPQRVSDTKSTSQSSQSSSRRKWTDGQARAIRQSNATAYRCAPCNDTFTDRSDYIHHLQHHGDVSK